MPQWVLIVLGALFWPVFIGGGLLLWRYLQKKRTEAMKAVASDLGLEFSMATDDALLNKLQSISLFSPGKYHKMKNVMTSRKDSMNLAIFDYSYVDDRGDRSHHAHSALVIESDLLRLPVFALHPEGLAERVLAALGNQDIDFDDHPKFSKSFVLEGEDEEAIRSVFDDEVIEALEALPVAMKIAVVGMPGMLVYLTGGRQKPAKIGKFMDDGCAVFSAFARRMSHQP